MKKVQLSYIFLIFTITWGFAQCPDLSFDLPASVCLEESLFLSNLQDTASDYTWDFCSGDILNEAIGEELTTLMALSNLRGIVTDYETGNGLIGFAIGENNKVVRIRFGETIDPANIQVEELTTVSSFLNVPRGISKVLEGNQKYLLIANSTDGSLVRVSFGTTYTTASPTRTTIAGPVGLSGLRGLSTYRQGSRLVAFVSGIGVGNSQISVLDFSSGITSAPVQSTINIPGAGGLNQVRVLNDCGQWMGLVSSFTQDRVYKLFFGNDLRTLGSSQSVNGIPSALASEIRVENGQYYGLVSTTSGSFWRVAFGPDFGAEDQTQLENLTNLGILSNITEFSVYERNSETVALVVGFSDKKLSAIRFTDACGATVLTSKAANPSGLKYSQSGLKNITLTGSDASGNVKRVNRQLTVQNSQSPQADFSIGSGNCANNAIKFTSSISSGSVSEYQWLFDGVEGSTTANASFAFVTAGEHTVRLVVGDGACANTIEKKVTIYEEVTPATYTLVGSLCTNNQVAVSNTTDDAAYPEGTVQYSWFLNGEQISTVKAPTITFPTSGAHVLRVVRSIPGCSAESIQNLVIDEGPVVTMDYTNSCWDADVMEANVHFSTSLSGDNYIYTWDFGDNAFSQEATPSHIYDTPGDYNVSVTVLDENTGCSISTTPKILGISDLSLLDFNFPGAYSGVPVEFEGVDQTPVGDEIVNWNWEFGSIGQSEEQNPEYVFSGLGIFEVRLEILTSRGCIDSITKDIEVFAYPCPIVDFTVPTGVCLNETLSIVNSGEDGLSYEWDFCEGDLHSLPSAVVAGTFGGGDYRGLAIKKDDDGWYLFATSRSQNLLKKVFLGSDINSTSLTATNPNIVEGQFSQPEPIVVEKEGSNWFGFIHNGGNSKVLRLSFGPSLSNLPSVEELVTEVGALHSNMKLIEEDGRKYLLLTDHFTNELTVISLGTSLNAPKAEIVKQKTLLFTASNNLIDVDVFRECDQWYGLAITFNSRKVYKLTFGNSLFNQPEVLDITNGNTFVSSPYRIEISFDAGKPIGLVTTNNGTLYRLIVLDDILSSETLGNFGVLAGTLSFDLAKEASIWRGFSINNSNGSIYRIDFPNECEGENITSVEKEPRSTSYSTPGIYQATLKATSESGRINSMTRTITVSDLQASPIDFSLGDSRCLGNTNQFNFIGDAAVITTYSWDFDGDGVEDSAESNPAWQFPAAGDYEVTLTVGNSNGCTNSAKKTISIYDPPAPVFEYEQAEVMCSNSPIQFTDLTAGLPEDQELATYLWDFNGEATSDERDPAYTFETADEKTITLTISIPGCEGTSSQSIVLLQGSVVGFSVPNQCLGGETQFVNETTGDGITGYQWNFGDDYTSTQTSPSVFFAEAGDYEVSLTATNSLGCENTITEAVSIRALPVVDFSHDLACSGTGIQFTDKSTALLANVVEWEWEFGSLGTSADKNPEFIFPAAGTYDVRLTATSNYGCTATLAKEVTVIEGTTADFTVAPNCVGEPVVFKDIPTSNIAITSRRWTINGKNYTTAEVAETFTEAGEYDVTLQVTNSNLCSSSITKSFEVYPLPAADFQFNSNCTNELIEFVATENPDQDVISRVWDFAGQAPANGARAYYQFKQPGDYNVSLDVLSADGCRSVVSKVVTVNEAPTAAFSHTSPYGQMPVTVDFSDASVGGSSRVWFVGDGVEPVSEEPDFSSTFNEQGDYLISLVAANDAGCSDTLVQVIGVAPPMLDLQLQSIHHVEENGVISFVATLENRGTMNVSDFAILINVDDKITATEVFEGTLVAGQVLAHRLTFELVAGANEVDKVCMELIAPAVDDEIEFSPFDNLNCLSLSGAFQAGMPYPNPVEEVLTLQIILPASGDVELALLGLSGQPVVTENFTGLQAGLTSVSIQMAHYKPGMYLLRIRGGGKESVQRVMKK